MTDDHLVLVGGDRSVGARGTYDIVNPATEAPLAEVASGGHDLAAAFAHARDAGGRDVATALLQANNRPKPLHLLAFKDRGGRELLAESLIDSGIEVDPSSLSPLGLIVRGGDPFTTDGFERGDFYVQDEASQVAALLPPQLQKVILLNTGSEVYGGSNVGNAGVVQAAPRPWHGRPCSASMVLPPLAAVWLAVPEP